MTQEIVKRSDQSLLPNNADWQQVKELALMAFQSAFYKDLNSKEKAAVVVLQGMELGLKPMAALRNIYVVEGKPSLAANLMAALVIQAGHPRVMTVELTEEKCTLKARRREETDWSVYTYTMKDAERAGLNTRQTYSKHPKNMLYARAMGNICRQVFPDIFAGLYTPEELSDNVVVDADVTIVQRSTGETITPVEGQDPWEGQIIEPAQAAETQPAQPVEQPKMTFSQFRAELKRLMPKMDEKVAGAKLAGVFGFDTVDALMKDLEAKGAHDRFRFITSEFEHLVKALRFMGVKGEAIARDFGHETLEGLAKEQRANGAEGLPMSIIEDWIGLHISKNTVGFKWDWDSEARFPCEAEDKPLGQDGANPADVFGPGETDDDPPIDHAA